MTPLPCPRCKAQGKLLAATTHFAGLQRCPTCKGHRFISREHARRICEGRAMRQERIKRGLSIREAARKRGVTALKLAKMEKGKE